jgi:hypothetical protein
MNEREEQSLMKVRALFPAISLALGLALLRADASAALPAPAESSASTITITAVAKKDAPPSVTKDDVQFSVGKERKQIARWTKGEKLYLAVLIDDSLDTDVAGQWNELKQFMSALPPTTYIAVGYASNATVRLAQDFTNNHELAANALRIPYGYPGADSSPYLSVIDWMKRWPATGDRRSLLLISSGLDYLHGGFAPINPDVDTAISIAEKGNINLWNIYYPGAGHRSRALFPANNAQNNLSKLCEETGGEAYFLGTSAPVSFKPFLDELQMHLDNQYLLTFAGDGGPKGRFSNVRLKTELAHVEFMHANQAWLPPSK